MLLNKLSVKLSDLNSTIEDSKILQLVIIISAQAIIPYIARYVVRAAVKYTNGRNNCDGNSGDSGGNDDDGSKY